MRTLTRWERGYIARYVMDYFNIPVRLLSYYNTDLLPPRPKSDMPAHHSIDELRNKAKVIILMEIKGMRADLRNDTKKRLHEKER